MKYKNIYDDEYRDFEVITPIHKWKEFLDSTIWKDIISAVNHQESQIKEDLTTAKDVGRIRLLQGGCVAIKYLREIPLEILEGLLAEQEQEQEQEQDQEDEEDG